MQDNISAEQGIEILLLPGISFSLEIAILVTSDERHEYHVIFDYHQTSNRCKFLNTNHFLHIDELITETHAMRHLD